MADLFMWAVRFLHILTGVMWVGGLFLWGMVIAPSLTKRVPPPARGPAMGVIVPRLSRYFGIAGVITVLTGLWNMGLISGWANIGETFEGAVFGTTYGYALGASFIISIAMLVIAFTFIIPSSNRMLALGAKMAQAAPGGAPPAPPAEMMTLQKRLIMGGMVNLTLGFVALALMALAVNARVA